MATLDELERALRAADAAGNTDDARRLAQAYADARSAQAPSFANVESSVRGPVAEEEAESFLEREGRGLALGARSVMQGAGGLIGALGGDAFNAYVVNPIERALHKPTTAELVSGQSSAPVARPYREIAGNLADKAGLPQPQTARERVVGDVGEALTGTALTMGTGAALGPTNRLGQFLTAQPGLQAVSTATGAGAAGVTREQGGTQGQQLAAGLAGGLGPGLAGAGAAATTRGLVRGRSGEAMQQTIDDFRAVGATPSVGQASGNWLLQGGENLLSGAPTSAGVMNRFAERQAGDIGEGLQSTAEGIARNASGERAGRSIERGIDTFAKNARAQQRALYWQADRFIPEQTPVPTSNTWQSLVAMTTPTPGATATTGALVSPKVIQLRDNLMQDLAAGNGRLPYSALKAVRTQIGEQISDFSLTPDAPTRQLRQIYGALSRDMEAAAKAQGPEAERAARRANNYTRVLSDRLEQVQRIVDKNGGPERIFTAAMTGTRDGGTTLRSVMQSLPKEGQEMVTGAVIKRMGLANPGQQDAAGDAFNAATFLTNWNKVSPEAKRALFDRHGPQFSASMDRIARVADNIKQGSKVFANPSGTANRGAAITYGAGLVASLFDPSGATMTGLVGGGIAANAAARMLTNPSVVRRLAQATELPIGSIPAFINAVRVEGEKNEDEDLLQLAGQLQQSIDQGP